MKLMTLVWRTSISSEERRLRGLGAAFLAAPFSALPALAARAAFSALEGRPRLAGTLAEEEAEAAETAAGLRPPFLL